MCTQKKKQRQLLCVCAVSAVPVADSTQLEARCQRSRAGVGLADRMLCGWCGSNGLLSAQLGLGVVSHMRSV